MADQLSKIQSRNNKINFMVSDTDIFHLLAANEHMVYSEIFFVIS